MDWSWRENEWTKVGWNFRSSAGCSVGLSRSTRIMMLSMRNEEYFVIVSLCVVSPGLRTMHSHGLQRGYLERRIFIRKRLPDALLVDRSHR
jgi:hypothetical protein